MHIILDTAFTSTEFVSYLLRRCTNRATSIYSLCQVERMILSNEIYFSGGGGEAVGGWLWMGIEAT